MNKTSHLATRREAGSGRAGIARRESSTAQAFQRAALAVSSVGGPQVFEELVRSLAAILTVDVAFVAVFRDDDPTRMRTLATWLDGKLLRNFDYALAGSPCASVVGREFRYVASGVNGEFKPDTIFAAKGMDSYAAYPLNDADGEPLGLLVTMQRTPIANPAFAEAVLKIFAVRAAAEIERERTEDALRRAALAVSSAKGDAVFHELVRDLAGILGMDMAFIARRKPDDPATLQMLVACLDGRAVENVSYPVAGTPCETIIGQHYRAYPSGLRDRFPLDGDFAAFAFESYAGFPLMDTHGAPLGLISVVSRKPLRHPALVESILKIFAMRAAAEFERRRADEALRVSEASYRAIFEAAEDPIFVHDWDTGAIADVNPTACAVYGYSHDEMLRISLDDLSSGAPPFTGAEVRRRIEEAKEHGAVQFEWHRRNRDGSLRWDEVRLKRAMIGGKPRVLAFTRDITERKLAEERLRASEEQYRAIFNASEDALILWNSSFKRVDVNPAYERIYGFTRAEVIGRGYEGTPRSPGYAQPRLDLVKRGLAGERCHVELQSIRKNGERFDAEVHTIPIQYRGEPHVLAIVRDITERRRAEAAVRASDEQYRAVFAASADGIVVRDADFRIVDINPAALAMIGRTRDEVIGLDRLVVLADGQEDRIRALHDRVLAGGSIRYEVQGEGAEGKKLDLEIRLMPMQHRGRPHVLSIARNLTDLRAATEALSKTEEQYRAVFNASIDGMIIRALDGTVVDVNPALEAMSGYSRSELVGLNPSPTIPEEAIGTLRGSLSEIAAGRPFRIESLSRRKDGSVVFVEVHGSPVTYQGRPHLLAVVRDITARKRAEEERLALEAQLRQAQKMEAIGHLTGGIAHDFNNILTSVMGYVGLATERESVARDGKLGGYLEQALRSCRRARDLIQQMLVFSRGQRGERRPTDLAPIVEESTRLLHSTLPATLELRMTIDAGVPQVDADRIQAEQVLLNLAINARDAMMGSGTLTIGLHGREVASAVCASCRKTVSGRFVELAVSDTGPGISAAVMDRMFEPFYSTKEVGKGSGMGLATVHGIVHDHGGHILVESTPGRGTTFRALLPVLDCMRRGSEAPAEQDHASRPGARLRGYVLVVDDETSVAAFMRELLEGWGLVVTESGGPRDALDRLTREPSAFDLVVTDLTMPGMTGLQLAREIAAINPALPVILSTGYSEGVTDSALQDANIRAVLRKPIEPATLRALLEAELTRRTSTAT
jgi:PAS domain S-box-containing protein